MPGMGRGYPGMTENRPLTQAQGYVAAAANAPPPNVTGPTWGAASGSSTPSATIGAGYTGQVGPGMQTPYSGAAATLTPPAGAQGGGGAYGPNIIGNNLPWSNSAGSMMNALSADPATTIANLGPAYKNAYDDYLNFSIAQTNNINAGYAQTAQNQFLGQQATQAGYGNLSRDVLGGISNIGSDQLALINRNYAGQAGHADQNLINSGLGNSTVRSSVQRGIGLDQNLAQNNLANSIAQTKAGYQSQIGLSGLGYQGQSVRDNTNLATHQLDWMNSISAHAPDAAQYGALAQQAGAAIQSNANRAQIDRLASQNSDLGAQVRQAAVLGGSGGMSPGTGGRLPPSAINYAGGVGSPGMGTSPLNFGNDFIQSGSGARPPGTGGGNAMQQALGPKPAFGSGLAGTPGVTNYMGGPAGGIGGGAGMAAGTGGVPSAQAQYAQYAATFGQAAADAVYAAMGFDPNALRGGYDQQPGAADAAYGLGSNLLGGAYSENQGPSYDYGFGLEGIGAGAAGGANFAMNDNFNYYPDVYDAGQGAFGGAFDALGQTAFPGSAFSAGAVGLGAGAFGGLSDYWEE